MGREDYSKASARGLPGRAPFSLRLRQRGTLTLELVVAMGILSAVLIPLGFSFAYEMKLCRAYYFKAVAMEIIDGEMEVLLAGEWKRFQRGEQPYRVEAAAATNLPPGRFVLTLEEKKLALLWRPEKRGKGGPVIREAPLPIDAHSLSK